MVLPWIGLTLAFVPYTEPHKPLSQKLYNVYCWSALLRCDINGVKAVQCYVYSQ